MRTMREELAILTEIRTMLDTVEGDNVPALHPLVDLARRLLEQNKRILARTVALEERIERLGGTLDPEG